MSLGYIGYCRKDIEDDQAVIYKYSGSDWNNRENDNAAEEAYDGEIFIYKSVIGQTSVIDVIDSGEVKIMRPCQNATYRGSIMVDYIAYRIIYNLLQRVLNEGFFPDTDAFIQ